MDSAVTFCDLFKLTYQPSLSSPGHVGGVVHSETLPTEAILTKLGKSLSLIP